MLQYPALSTSDYKIPAIWALLNGVLAGTSESTLGLVHSLNREQAAVFFQSYPNKMGLTYRYTNGPRASSFADYNKVSKWAQEAMDFCTKRFLLAGALSNGHLVLNPRSILTRAEIAVILHAITQKASR